jgi:hypothetical protein
MCATKSLTRNGNECHLWFMDDDELSTPTETLVEYSIAVRLLDCSRTTFWRLLKKHNIEPVISPEGGNQRAIRASDLRRLRDSEREEAA